MYTRTLVKTVVTEPLLMIGNEDLVYTFKIELFLDSQSQYSAMLWRLFHCDISVPPNPQELLFRELISSLEESLGVDEILEESEELAMGKVLLLLEERYSVV